jgi:hypothetical protein
VAAAARLVTQLGAMSLLEMVRRYGDGRYQIGSFSRPPTAAVIQEPSVPDLEYTAVADTVLESALQTIIFERRLRGALRLRGHQTRRVEQAVADLEPRHQ